MDSLLVTYYAIPIQLLTLLDNLNRRPEDLYLKENLNTQIGQVELKLQNVVVRINRPEDVAKGRENLPIVMMEQEIMETTNENDVVIVCGET
jgi:HrpA-like RNA helicase